MNPLLTLLFTAIALYGFYWVIRYAVRGGIEDADRRRAQRERAVPQPREVAEEEITR